MLLSTHHLDEADLLSDRCAIIAHGRLQCNDSPLQLKRKYGVGYRLIMSLQDHAQHAAITAAIQSHIARAALTDESLNEVVYALPVEEVSRFEALLKHLESNREALQFTSYGLSATTLEEVFLTVLEKAGTYDKPSTADNEGAVHSHEHDTELLVMPRVHHTRPTDPSVTRRQPEQAFPLYLQRYKALFLKRFQYTRRDIKAFFSQILLPVLFICIAMLIANVSPDNQVAPSVTFKPTYYLAATCDGEPINTVPYIINTTNASSSALDFIGFVASEDANLMHYLNLANDSEFLHPNGACGEPCTYPSNISSYILDSYAALGGSRLVAIGIYDNIPDPIIGVANYYKPEPVQDEVIVAMYATNAYHSLPLAINTVNSAQLQQLMNTTNVSITTIFHPLNYTYNDLIDPSQQGATDLSVAIFTIAALSFVPASFLIFLVAERATKVRRFTICIHR